MSAPFRSGAAVPACAARRSLALARIALATAEQNLDDAVLRLRAGHIRLAPGRRDEDLLRDLTTAVFAKRMALDEARFAALGIDADAWEDAGRRGEPTPNDEDDLGSALHDVSEANWERVVRADEVPGEPTFRDDVRATLVAGAGYR